MNFIEIGIPQISGRCPYKVVNSQWVPTRPQAMQKTKILERQKGMWQRYINENFFSKIRIIVEFRESGLFNYKIQTGNILSSDC